MRKSVLAISAVVLFLAGSLLLSCGGSSAPQHSLSSITLSPANADAKDYPKGEVQFTATGNYSTAPVTETAVPATWGTCDQFAPTTAVSVTDRGLAQCASSAVGTFTVFAYDPPPNTTGAYSCPAQTACGGGCVIQGSAQLTCP